MAVSTARFSCQTHHLNRRMLHKSQTNPRVLRFSHESYRTRATCKWTRERTDFQRIEATWSGSALHLYKTHTAQCWNFDLPNVHVRPHAVLWAICSEVLSGVRKTSWALQLKRTMSAILLTFILKRCLLVHLPIAQELYSKWWLATTLTETQKRNHIA